MVNSKSRLFLQLISSLDDYDVESHKIFAILISSLDFVYFIEHLRFN